MFVGEVRGRNEGRRRARLRLLTACSLLAILSTPSLLTEPALAQAADGTPGADAAVTNPAGTTLGPAASPVVNAESTGGGGGDGAAAGEAGGNGGNGGTATATNDGTAIGTNTAASQTRAVEFGLVTELADTTDALNAINREFEVRQAVEAVNNATGENFDPTDPADRLLADGEDPADGGGFLTAAERAALGVPGPTTISPYIGLSQNGLVSQFSEISELQAFLQGIPGPDEVPGTLTGVVRSVSSGGDGGNGGGVLSGAGTPTAGAGGAGGNGGTVEATNTGTITATGNRNAGLLARSVGGAGGTGGPSTGISNGNGGAGGDGGIGGAVTVTNSGTISTDGDIAPGIFAQSKGGNGGLSGAGTGFGVDGTPGSGGSASTVAVSQNGTITTTGTRSYGLYAGSEGGSGASGLSGGVGGTGGNAGNVTADINGAVTTGGDFAHGVFITSVGGSGGEGGDSGGEGGTGGTSADAAATLFGASTVITTGESAVGVLVQSRGGTGGPGGDDERIFFGDAGGGGNGGVSGNATITSGGAIDTTGIFAHGLFAQSLGGAGGVGGDAAGIVAFSGEGGGGADAGNAGITNNGRVITRGAGAHGVFSQSVAGSGGDAGSAGGLVALGGEGGTGGEDDCRNLDTCNDGGTATITNTGSVSTSGTNAFGLFGQSVGGGGGNGGGSTGLVSIGGGGGPGGDGGAVTVSNSGRISTSGDGGNAIVAQSIGGGGGNGGGTTSFGALASVAIGGSGGTGGDGGAVDVDNTSTVTVTGDRASAIFAQTVGGGGGNGGDAFSATLGLGALAIGGAGGDGGAGGILDVFNSGNLFVGGERGFGIFAQSIGGGGGSGGAAGSISAGVFTAAVSIGGSGGDGGDNAGSSVTVTNLATITTTGDNTQGIFAQNVGGGGGTGGSATSTAIAASPAPNIPSVAVAVSIGGSGGDGGSGGSATVVNEGQIVTGGDASHAIQAQSVGGGGGTGGDASASAQAQGGKTSIAVDIGLGGSGGGGGDGAAVSVTNRGTITTEGEIAHGIYAQSVGGGGGDGGIGTGSGETDAAGSSTRELSVSVAVGGSGGSGGVGGTVNVLNEGVIGTSGTGSRGIFAQSVGGGGGAAGGGDGSSRGQLSLSAIIGGSGGAGGDGNTVRADNRNMISTSGADADGIFAQSVGGGGGLGGSANADAQGRTSTNRETYAIGVAIGGSGGVAGAGGNVSAVNSGTIVTRGANARGIFAQSVGGGGGTGGGVQSSGSAADSSFALSLGGRGAAAGNGGTVDVTNSGSIITQGSDAFGIFAQSVGGGGGYGGAARGDATAAQESENQKGALALLIGGTGGAAGDGGAVTVTNTNSVDTSGFGAHGVVAQSVGGGGGMGGAGGADAGDDGAGGNSLVDLDTIFDDSEDTDELGLPDVNLGDAPEDSGVTVGGGIGGSGGSSGEGGTVTVDNAGSIVTRLADAFGIFAQSIGGGGGAGAAGNAFEGEKNLNVAVGGSAGSTGNGGTVRVEQIGDVTTLGNRSYGIFAQSVGGGGGIGGTGNGNNSGTINVGGAGGAGGNGGLVDVDVTGVISTAGSGAHGVVAQSVGGGGGVGGSTEGVDFQTGFGLGGVGGSAGDGGSVNVDVSGGIQTIGNRAFGIFAQSVGGGGGFGGGGDGLTSFAGSNGGNGVGGDVTVNSTGNVIAWGEGAHGIFAQSVGRDGEGGDVIVTVTDGVIQGGTGDAAGIVVDSGATNIVNVTENADVSALSGEAIRTVGGDDTVENLGVVTGNVDLGANINQFNNRFGARFNAGTSILVGTGNTLLNEGVFSPGGFNEELTSALGSLFVQTASGEFELDVSFSGAGSSDLLTVSETASLDGIVDPNLLTLVTTDPEPVFLTSVGATTDNGVEADDTVTVDYDLIIGTNESRLSINSVDFSPDGLNGDDRAIGDHFNAILATGEGDDLGTTMAALGNAETLADLEGIFDQFNPEGYGAALTTNAASALGFSQSLLSCRVGGGGRSFIEEGECAWGQAVFSRTERDETGDDFSRDVDSITVASGVQRKISENWFAGFGLGYEEADIENGATNHFDTSRFDVGGVLKRQEGRGVLAAAATVSTGWLDGRRSLTVPTAAIAESDTTFFVVGSRFRAAYLAFSDENGYVKPVFDAGFQYSLMDGFRETGAGALNVIADDIDNTSFFASPAIEFGGNIQSGNGEVRPYLRVGALIRSDTEADVSARFEGTPASVGDFTVSASDDEVLGTVSAGIEFFSTGNKQARLTYDGAFSDNTVHHAGGVRFTIGF